jgi:hypothetical protein
MNVGIFLTKMKNIKYAILLDSRHRDVCKIEEALD